MLVTKLLPDWPMLLAADVTADVTAGDEQLLLESLVGKCED